MYINACLHSVYVIFYLKVFSQLDVDAAENSFLRLSAVEARHLNIVVNSNNNVHKFSRSYIKKKTNTAVMFIAHIIKIIKVRVKFYKQQKVITLLLVYMVEITAYIGELIWPIFDNFRIHS